MLFCVSFDRILREEEMGSEGVQGQVQGGRAPPAGRGCRELPGGDPKAGTRVSRLGREGSSRWHPVGTDTEMAHDVRQPLGPALWCSS